MAQSILIVDDEKEIVSMLYCYFSKLGYTVYTATAGNAALKEVEKKPDIILLDVNMPDIDGFTVCERIRDYVSCPIIFLTARIEDSDKIKGFSIGADDYVIKPFSVDELEARIAAHLRREKRHNIPFIVDTPISAHSSIYKSFLDIVGCILNLFLSAPFFGEGKFK